ncbi:SDR family NAD(P)-dependent oxidoreductase [Roseicyclus mahoneyensis]|jgi:NAD(P)-dependent dehydrogenase (short-subunit alcohol dehydrogenase family)|uniref:NADP-dependent 3-hydroxy acid dehydrogenase YdfG n=1 Tax=Roseicyclus mahoneyensis TaxID=164332 RepID=A0A316GE94_9RHOB|nr:SDR family NAD(P)-dependent oxidoreductase [Roseicyclus mahoneyensis]PWK59264.1 NADP-dependent 3-hydroxy acid dehydrogenase YdfG [Roseicyclus mahoneyensis]
MEHALVIGASGGIGRAVAQELRARGATVTTLSRAADGLDVTDAASVAQAMGRLEGPFQTVFISVGILAPEGASPEKQLSAIDPASMARVFAVNTIGVAQVLSNLPRLLPKKGRSVTGVLTAKVGSIGDNKIGGWHSYRASKAALNQIVHGAGIELARSHRDAVIAALHPGTVDTSFTEGYNPGYGKTAPDEAARNLCDVMARLTTAQSGGFYDYSGAELPW